MDTTTAAKFDAIIRLDREAHTNHVLATLGSDGATRERGRMNFRTSQDRFLAALDALTPEEVPALLAYRRAQMDLTV